MAEFLPKEVAMSNPSKYHHRYYFSGYLDYTFLKNQMKSVDTNIRRMIFNFMWRFPQLNGYILEEMLKLKAAISPIILDLQRNYTLSKEWIIILMHIGVSKMDRQTKKFWKNFTDNTYDIKVFMDFIEGSIQHLQAISELNFSDLCISPEF